MSNYLQRIFEDQQSSVEPRRNFVFLSNITLLSMDHQRAMKSEIISVNNNQSQTIKFRSRKAEEHKT